MTAAAALAYPGGRALGGWWRQLAPLRPRALWVAHLFLHHVEAHVRVGRPCRPDRLSRLALEAVALSAPGPVHERLHLGPQAAGRVLRELEQAGLVKSAETGLVLTGLGASVRQHGEYSRVTYERRAFYFVDGAVPRFLALRPGAATSWPAAADWHFDVAWLKECLLRPAEWKRCHGFPLDVDEVVDLMESPPAGGEPADPTAPDGATDWQRVVLDRAERLLVALVLAPDSGGGERLLGFSVQQRDWSVDTTRPVLELGSCWQETFSPLREDPAAERWRQAWRGWALGSGLPVPEVDACRLERVGHRLRVLAPKAVIDRLRAARAEALRGDTWLLAGEERLRAAAAIEIVVP
jgi:hypothetical protein